MSRHPCNVSQILPPPLLRAGQQYPPPLSIHPLPLPRLHLGSSHMGFQGIRNIAPKSSNTHRMIRPGFRPVKIGRHLTPHLSSSVYDSNDYNTEIQVENFESKSRVSPPTSESKDLFIPLENSSESTVECSIKSKTENCNFDIPKNEIKSSGDSGATKFKFIRRPDGKGFMKKGFTANGFSQQQQNQLQQQQQQQVLKKRKKRNFRGLNYRFDGSSIRKKKNSKIHSKNYQESGISESSDSAVLNYLGITRKDPPVSETLKNVEPKAKKSFRAIDHPVRDIRKRSIDELFLSSKGKRSIGGPIVKNSFPLPPKVQNSRRISFPCIIKSETLETPIYICSCANAPMSYKDQEIESNCEAIESVCGFRIGCSNVSELKSAFCSLHNHRLANHQICCFCQEFCSHGIFYMCRPHKGYIPHVFHQNCWQSSETKSCCHCGSSSRPLSVSLKLKMASVPLHCSVSKISFGKGKKEGGTTSRRSSSSEANSNSSELLSFSLGNGSVISSKGLPEGLQNETLQTVLAELEDKQISKHATRNMYIPTKAGDNVKILQLLSLGYSANQKFSEFRNGTPLHVASAEGYVLTLHILIQAGSELNAVNDDSNTSLHIAASKGKTEVVRYLLQAGADPKLRGSDGMTCLHFATQNGHLDAATVILNQNNLPRNFINIQDEGGWTPLVWACENRHEHVITYLLKRGANPLITDTEGNTALHWASLSGSRYACELLLNGGCYANSTNSIGDTPIHIALRQDHYETAVLLLMRGAKINIKNKSGQLAVNCISGDSQCKSIIKLSSTLQSLMKNSSGLFHEKIVMNDITKSKEFMPIQCVNGLDDEKSPTNYIYVKSNCVTNPIPLDRNISTLQHCKCEKDCSSEDSCHCSDMSVKSWYDSEGRLKSDFDFKEPPILFECNDLCICVVSTCHNRVVQNGITVRLQVFRANGMGWGVRALSDIPQGSFVCEYVGEIISDSEAETREDSYLFDLDNREGRDTYCIDANRFGNIARFINHCCTPNLTPVKVFAEHQDLRFPHIAFFANRMIPKGTELGFDYGEKFWVIKHKNFNCHCQSDKCRYSKSTIQSFLKDYYRRFSSDSCNGLNGTLHENSSVKSSGDKISPNFRPRRAATIKNEIK